tara:strand:- start:1289 stop:1606 length:318 start_codon:yes stop_codon:yes gene_type:complete
MDNLNNYTDVFAALVGVMGALLKGLKSKMSLKQTFLGMLVGGILAYCTIGIIDEFLPNLSQRATVLVSFAVGWVANELTDILDKFVKDAYDIFIAYLRSFFNRKK